MHLPNEFLNTGTAAGFAGVAALAVGLAVQKVRSMFLKKIPIVKARLATFPDTGADRSISLQSRLSKLGEEKMWRMAAVGSFIFSAQMVNFPIGGGTSGHLLGGALAALILGPLEALLVMTTILVVQALIFADGGILALGANIFNMGIVGAIGGYSYFRFLTRDSKSAGVNFWLSAFVAAWFSVVFAAIAASFEIAWSGTRPFSIVLPTMTLMHVLIGLVEGAITVVVLALLHRKKFPLEALKKEKIYAKK
ncbi:MAG: energy-coupling factor ABC transporter permease [Candidatus Moranbacteria bacterium]|nr:energy-coupling factor ABC transporter permease [Candidatus Moranbacteria bacterium]